MNHIYAHVGEIASRALELPDILFSRLNVITHAKAYHPELMKYEDRLNSFSGGEYTGIAPPDRLAQSGFFLLLNQGNTVKCFCCGYRLPAWRIGLNPEQQHKQFRKRCLYLCLKENAHPQLEHLKTCVVCMDKKSHYAILPCGHICTCHECLIQITRCPLCNVDITGLIKIYIPI